MEEYKQRIKQQALDRNIGALFHFTNLANLESIIDHGLVQRGVLDEATHPYAATDNARFDGRLNTVSLSISDVNYAMFASKRRRFPDANWVVLLLAPAILWSKDCRFCERNAASREMISKHGAQAGPNSFRHLFIDDYSPFPARNDAEVLVYGQIEPSFIRAGWTDGKHLAIYVQKQLDRISGEDLPTYICPFDWPGLYREE